MGYMHIENLDRPKGQRLLLFREVYGLEKVFGTSACVSWRQGALRLSSYGADRAEFLKFFDQERLADAFKRLGRDSVDVHGEAYGGKEQGQSGRYGNELRFIAFDVKIGDLWLAVPAAHQVSESLGLEFVPYRKVSTDMDALRALRDEPSEVAQRRGIAKPVDREGIVLHPLIELRANDGERLVAKFKGRMFSERKTFHDSPEGAQRTQALSDAEAIAEEWVTEMRLTRVLQHLRAVVIAAPQPPFTVKDSPCVAAVMLADVLREASGEIVESKEAERAIKRRAVALFQAWLKGSAT